MARFRNELLMKTLEGLAVNENALALQRAAQNIPKPNATNLEGHAAYKLDKWLRLLSMLNTLKLEAQFYRNESEQVRDLALVLDECAREDVYLAAQCIVYSRCVGEGMRTVNHLAAVLLAKYAAGAEWAKRFYGLWDKKAQKGGVVFRPDDMRDMLDCWTLLHATNDEATARKWLKAMPNAMKKGFQKALENLDAYSILKYKNSVIDVANLVHPNPTLSRARVVANGEKMPAITAVMRGLSATADTWEVAQSEAGRLVADAKRAGKLTEVEAEKVLKEAKAANWKSLLEDGKLGILAALRNIRNILATNATADTIRLLCELLQNPTLIRQGKIMPFQIDVAQEIVSNEFGDKADGRRVVEALAKGYELAIPNLRELLTGLNLVILDCSGSMSVKPNIAPLNAGLAQTSSSCLDKASLLAATIAKATNADVICFGSEANWATYSVIHSVFDIAKSIRQNMGSTNLAKAWQLAAADSRLYDRVFILSDNECNHGKTYNAYQAYVSKVGNPYVYSIDMAAYGTTALAGDRVRYYYGYGFAMFDDIARVEFNPSAHLDKVRKIVI